MDAQEPIAACCDETMVRVRLTDGREIATPLWWYPPLLAAGHAKRNTVELMFSCVRRPDLDEDLSIEGMLKGRRYPNAVPSAEAAE